MSRKQPGTFAISLVTLLVFAVVCVFCCSAARAGGKVGSMRVNGKAVSITKVIKVTQREVVIEVFFDEPATDYRVCENAGFEGPECAWKQIAGGADRGVAKITLTLSEGSGIKTVYFQAKRGNYLGETVKLQFELG